MRSWLAAVALLGCAALSGCSSTPSSSRSQPAPASESTPPAAQAYLDAVNRLCDQLLPKVIAVTNGGRFDIPRRQFFEQLAEHQRLRNEFDADLAKIPVPSAAQRQARALAAYLTYADELDRKRLAAARQGPVAYRREIAAEKLSAADHPSIQARDAAGFHDSCNAR